MKKSTIPASNSKSQVKKTDESVKQLILNRVNKIPHPSEDLFSDENFDKYNEKETILDMVSKMPYRKFVSKGIEEYRKRFKPSYYKQLYRLTNLKPDPNNPHYKPWKFARLTMQIIYRSFPDGIIEYFNEQNPADATGFRMYKHHQLLSKLGVKKLLEILKNATRVMEQASNWDHFLRLYGKELNYTYQGGMFED
jgi:P63C domain